MEKFESHKVKEIIQDTLGLCNEKFKSHGVILNLSVPEDLAIECNPLDVSQVLINLINNAFYAIKDHPEKEISIAAHAVGEHVTISVMDSGPGICPTLKSKILEPFFTTKPFGEGSGLGLSISNSILKVHNGELYLDETVGKTKFVVKLPVFQARVKAPAALRLSSKAS